MLKNLTIKNIVLIEQIEFALGTGLCVLSGETGAGKSILLDALGLAIGGKSDAKLVRAGEDKASITAVFDISDNPKAMDKFTEFELDLDDETEIVIRRTLAADGKSKSFINDIPISTKALKTIGESLIEIHGQHNQRGLLDSSTHITFLDSYGSLAELLNQVEQDYASWAGKSKDLRELEKLITKASEDKEYMEHMSRELLELAPEIGEEEQLSDERTGMMQSEKMAGVLDDALMELKQPRDTYDALRQSQSVLSRSTLRDAEKFSPAIDALEKAMIELDEARIVLENLGNNLGFDQYELEKVEERLFALKAAGRKYNLPVDELPTLQKEVEEKLLSLANYSEQLIVLTKQVAEFRVIYLSSAEKLSQSRQKAAKNLEKSVMGELEFLKMKSTIFKVSFSEKPEQKWDSSGIDEIFFEVSTNKGGAFGALSEIASGGELSRFMLALTIVLANVESASTMIFDEIDTGTGGSVADAIGSRLQNLGEKKQILVVTHLPQVAARGNQHFFIEKQETASKTITTIKELDDTTRHEELARMLSGASVTDEARGAARKLLEAAA